MVKKEVVGNKVEKKNNIKKINKLISKEKRNKLNKNNECKCNKIIMNISIAKSRRIMIGRPNIKTYTSEVQRDRFIPDK